MEDMGLGKLFLYVTGIIIIWKLAYWTCYFGSALCVGIAVAVTDQGKPPQA
jgi:hypothetical protein